MYPNAANPAVDAILRDGKRRQRQRRGSAAERKEARRQAARTRITLDLHPDVIAVLKKTAQRLGCSPASIANLMLATGLYECSDDDIGESLVACPSNRWDWMVDLERNGWAGRLRLLLDKED